MIGEGTTRDSELSLYSLLLMSLQLVIKQLRFLKRELDRRKHKQCFVKLNVEDRINGFNFQDEKCLQEIKTKWNI